jgi:GTPase SAR1 family protein
MRDNHFKETVPTVGLNIEHIQYKRYSMTLWDVGGQATKLWRHYFDSINAIIFTIDTTDEERMMFARDELVKILSDPNLEAVPILLYYNKQDLGEKCKSKEEINGRLDIETMRLEREIHVQECSALNGVGVWEGVDKLVSIFEDKKMTSR